MEPSQIALVTVIASLVLGGGGLFGAWKIVTDSRKAPLDRKQVRVATDSQQITDAINMATAADGRARDADTRATAADTRATEAYEEAREARREARVDREEAKATRAENAETRRIAEEALHEAQRANRRSDVLIRWAHDIVADWPVIRLREEPPSLPPEAHHKTQR